MRRRCLTALACLMALALAVPAAARPPGKDARRLLQKLEQNAARLELSAATLAEMRAIVDAEAPESDALNASLRGAHDAMRELLNAPRPDEAAVMRQADEIGALETALLKHRMRTLLRIRPLLSDAQLAELKRIRGERIAPVLTACAAEIPVACPNLRGREMIDCLRDRADLSDACQRALDARRRR